jgi:hypothetical protein
MYNTMLILELEMMLVDQDHDYHVLIDPHENDVIEQRREKFHVSVIVYIVVEQNLLHS